MFFAHLICHLIMHCIRKSDRFFSCVIFRGWCFSFFRSTASFFYPLVHSFHRCLLPLLYFSRCNHTQDQFLHFFALPLTHSDPVECCYSPFNIEHILKRFFFHVASFRLLYFLLIFFSFSFSLCVYYLVHGFIWTVSIFLSFIFNLMLSTPVTMIHIGKGDIRFWWHFIETFYDLIWMVCTSEIRTRLKCTEYFMNKWNKESTLI